MFKTERKPYVMIFVGIFRKIRNRRDCCDYKEDRGRAK